MGPEHTQHYRNFMAAIREGRPETSPKPREVVMFDPTNQEHLKEAKILLTNSGECRKFRFKAVIKDESGVIRHFMSEDQMIKDVLAREYLSSNLLVSA